LGMVGSLLKWGIIGLLVLLIPWLIIPVGIYIAWKFGLFKRLKGRRITVTGRIQIRDRISRFNVSSSGGLHEQSAGYTYYVPCNDSPFALIPDHGRFRCVSAFIISDKAGSTSNYKRALNEAVKVLSSCSSTVILTLRLSNGTEVGCMIQVAEPCPVEAGDGWFRSLGETISNRAGLLTGTVHSLSPSLKVKICRGRQILQSPIADEGGLEF